jgi:regulator of protease activity HflC (stomatin/prohibitin superfamily)
MVELMEAFPVEVNSPQIENIVLPEQYLTAVMAKEQARENTAKEQHVLNQQKLIAQQAVQTAEADRDAQIARADGQAYQTRTEAAADADALLLRATAEAAGLQKIADALAGSPTLIEYEQVKKWAGQVPTTVLGNGQLIFYSLKQQ